MSRQPVDCRRASGRFERRRDCRERPAMPSNEAVESRDGGRIAQDDCDGPTA